MTTARTAAIPFSDAKDMATEEVFTSQLQVGDMALGSGYYREVLRIETFVAISEYELFGEGREHRHSWMVKQQILARTEVSACPYSTASAPSAELGDMCF